MNLGFYTPVNEVCGVYWSHPVCPSVRVSQNLVQGITSKVLKLVTSNFMIRLATLWRSAVYKNHNSIPTIFGVIALCKF